MTSFAYRAVRASGSVSRGEMVAANENELQYLLGQSGLELIEAREVNTGAHRTLSFSKRVSLRVLASFCARIHDLLLSGMAFTEALHDVQVTIENRVLADALAQVYAAIADGKGIAASFGLFPNLFPPVFIAIVSAGEQSGDMTVIFNYLARYIERQALTRERLRKALRYPLFLFFVAGGAVTFMMTIVVPQIVAFLKGLDSHLPLATRILVGTATFISDHGLGLLLGLLSAVIAVVLGRMVSDSFTLKTDRMLIKLPVVGNLVLKTSLSRFAHSFAILFKSGCDVTDCLGQAGQTVLNRGLRADVDAARLRVTDGCALSTAMENFMPLFAIGLLRTGERSGNLAKSFDDISDAYDREAAEATDKFIGMLEPLLTLMVGGVLAWTVVAVLGPLYGSLGVLGARM